MITYSEESSALNRQLIEKIYTSDGQFVIAVTGGGTSFISELFSVAGASSTVLEAIVPYHETSLSTYLRSEKTHDCSSPTARAMAMVAYERAISYGAGDSAFGIGCTAAVATNRDRRGSDRCHVAVQSARETLTFDLELSKEEDRAAQEARCQLLLLYAVATHMGLASEDDAPKVSSHRVIANDAWSRLLTGEISRSSSKAYELVFPGAFNPLHDGHRGMIEVAKSRVAGELVLELSIENVDKPPLDFMTMQERDTEEYDMVFTRAPTFAQKVDLFPGATFVVGLDTIVRIDDPKYYENSEALRDRAINHIKDSGNRFLVFGRLADGQFQSLSDVSLTPQLAALCDEVTADEFRLDISSTELRANRQS